MKNEDGKKVLNKAVDGAEKDSQERRDETAATVPDVEKDKQDNR